MPQSRIRASRAAFTLVELLVVISIIGVLMALLLPAVNAARMAALRTTCQARQKDLGKATTVYEASKKKFPSSFSWAEQDRTLTLPWTVRLLPYLEQQNLYDDIMYRNPDLSTSNVYIETFACAADAGSDDTAPLSYVANVGRPDLLDSPLSASDGNDVRNRKSTGIFHDARAFPNHDVNMLYVTKGDGSTNTLLYTENLNATTWNVTAPDDDTVEYLNGFAWVADMDPGMPLDIINSGDITSTTPAYRFSRPSANHGDTFNNTFADGSVRALSQEIDLTVFARIMTPRGADTGVAGQAVPFDSKELDP